MCRALLDTGSMTSIITEAAVKRLHLKSQSTEVTINGIANTTTIARRQVLLQIVTREGTIIETTALVVPTIASEAPPAMGPGYNEFKTLQLADRSTNNRAVELLLSSDVFFATIPHQEVNQWALPGPFTDHGENRPPPIYKSHRRQAVTIDHQKVTQNQHL